VEEAKVTGRRLDLPWLRMHAVSQSLFRPTTLKAAINRLGFVQADPIRSPARAQDLILRHRVKDYRAGDLERRYASLDLEEDLLYAYGFLPREIWRLLHPKPATALSGFEQRVLAAVRGGGPIHPRELDAQFGRSRVRNNWGGFSQATKRSLEKLHHAGHLRIARRDSGIRIYEGLPHFRDPILADERLKKLVLVLANIFAPIRLKALERFAAGLHRGMGRGPRRQTMVHDLLQAGELEQTTVNEVSYVWPASHRISADSPRMVRFLAPFDPLVWDRQRFEHFWEWPYRFEAYTPPAKRIRGYYAMPLLWVDRVVGWANASVVGSKLNIELGFVDKRPKDREFRQQLDAEVERLAAFLDVDQKK
jgi:uncharacterized protein